MGQVEKKAAWVGRGIQSGLSLGPVFEIDAIRGNIQIAAQNFSKGSPAHGKPGAVPLEMKPVGAFALVFGKQPAKIR